MEKRNSKLFDNILYTTRFRNHGRIFRRLSSGDCVWLAGWHNPTIEYLLVTPSSLVHVGVQVDVELNHWGLIALFGVSHRTWPASSRVRRWCNSNKLQQELITQRNSHVAGGQVPTCSKFTADKLDSYSKIVFDYIRYGVKYISVIDPYLKYRSCLNSFEEIKFNRCKPFPQFIH